MPPQLAAASERVRAALEQMDALVAAAGGKPGELAQKVQAEEEAEEAAEDAADAKAHRRSRAIKWLGLTGLLAHWCIFARLTYWRVAPPALPSRGRWAGHAPSIPAGAHR